MLQKFQADEEIRRLRRAESQENNFVWWIILMPFSLVAAGLSVAIVAVFTL